MIRTATLAAVILAFASSPALAHTHPTTTRVRVASGLLQGAVVSSGRQWLGVPYAAPPIGELRWRLRLR